MPNIAEVMEDIIFKHGLPDKVLVKYNLNGYTRYEWLDFKRAIARDFDYGAVDLYE